MVAFDDMRRGMGELRESLTEGWQELRQRAGSALTRFRAGAGQEDVETRGERLAQSAPGWAFLPVEINEQGDRVEVRLEVPGLEPDDIELYVEGGHLVVAGEKQVERELTEGRYHVMERAYGHFRRLVPLPCEVLDDRARASYRRGVLRVSLPRRAPDHGRRIRVQPGR